MKKEKIINLVIDKEKTVGEIDIKEEKKETEQLHTEKKEDELDLNSVIKEVKAIITQVELNKGIIEFTDLLESIKKILYIAKTVSICDEDYNKNLSSYVSKINSILSSVIYIKSDLETVDELEEKIRKVLDSIDIFRQDYEGFRKIKENAVLYAIFKQINENEKIDSNYLKDVLNSLNVNTVNIKEEKSKDIYEEKLNALYSKIAELDARIESLYPMQSDIFSLKNAVDMFISDIKELRNYVDSISNQQPYYEGILEIINKTIEKKLSEVQSQKDGLSDELLNELVEGMKKINILNEKIDSLEKKGSIDKDEINREISNALYPVLSRIEEIEKRLNSSLYLITEKSTKGQKKQEEKKYGKDLDTSDMIKLLSIIGGGLIFVVIIIIALLKFVL